VEGVTAAVFHSFHCFRFFRGSKPLHWIAALLIGVASSGSFGHGDAAIRISQLTHQIAADPENPALLLERGNLFRQTKQWPKASADISAALRFKPAWDAAEYAQGRLLFESGRFQSALEALNGFLSKHPTHPQALLIRARTQTALGNPLAAAEDYERVFDCLPSHSADLYGERVEALLAAGGERVKEAGSCLREALEELGQVVSLRMASQALSGPLSKSLPYKGRDSEKPPSSGGKGMEGLGPARIPKTTAEYTLTRGPYLQLGTPASVIVRWRTSQPETSRVAYGASFTALDCSRMDISSVTEHEIQLTGLEPDRKYYYSIGNASLMLSGGDPERFFVTSPVPGTRKPTRVWVLGDSGTANADARAVRDAYYAFTGARHTDLWLMLGDNAYVLGTDPEYQAAVFDTYPAMLKKSVLWPTMGNHDGYSANAVLQTGPYYENFTLPKAGEAGGSPSGTEAYYSFDYANIHFICLESFETPRSATGAMMTWLADDVAETSQEWAIAYWHHPPYSKGSHDSDVERELVEMRENALPILEAAGVDLVLTGHSHSYERSFLLDGHYGRSDTLEDDMFLDTGDGRPFGDGSYWKLHGLAPHDGAVYVVAGSSGKISGGSLDHPVMYLSLNTLGSLVLDVQGSRLAAGFLDSQGRLRDHFSICKGDKAGVSGWRFYE